MKIENRENITRIEMYPTAICRCKIGGDLYTNKFTVKFAPDKVYPDYMDVEKWILKNIDGKDLNIEEAVNLLYEYLQDEYKPAVLTVETSVEDVKTHFPVKVLKA